MPSRANFAPQGRLRSARAVYICNIGFTISSQHILQRKSRNSKWGVVLSLTSPIGHHALSKVDAHVRHTEAKGGKIILGGHKLSDLGKNFYQITVIVNAKPNIQISQEETFGPITALIQFEIDAKMIKLANSSEVNLAGYFCNKDLKRCWRIAETLEVGMVGINTGMWSSRIAARSPTTASKL